MRLHAASLLSPPAKKPVVDAQNMLTDISLALRCNKSRSAASHLQSVPDFSRHRVVSPLLTTRFKHVVSSFR